MAITAVTWSGNAVIGRAVHETVPPVGLNFWRWVVVLPVFIVLAWPHFRKDWPLVRCHWGILLFLAMISISGYNAFVYTGLNTTTAINMLMINAGRPVVIIFLAYLFLGERINLLQSLGLILALSGTMTIMARGDLDVLLGVKFISGDLWVVAATLGWAVYTVVFPRKPKIHPTNFMLVTVVMGLLVLLPFYVYETLFVRPVPFMTAEAWSSILYLGLIAGGLAYLCYNRMVEVLGAGKAGLTSYLVPVIGTILAITYLGEQFRNFHIAGIGLILAGVLLATRSRKEA